MTGTSKKKTVWILNHYATLMYKNLGGRHYSLAKEMSRQGYDVVIFCASTIHNSSEEVEVAGKYRCERLGGVTYVFVKCRPYEGNGVSRIANMLDYYCGVKKCANDFSRPDVIIGSSVHPLAQVAALQLARRYRCKCIVETRDLWPASLEEYGVIKPGGVIARIMYRNERRCYEKADAVVFTIAGGADYIRDKGWDVSHGGLIDIEKVHYINNGVDLEDFDNNRATIASSVVEPNDKTMAKLIYAGSVRKANGLGFLLDVAEDLREDRCEIVVVGSGDELESLRSKADERGLGNIRFTGAIPKKEVPATLESASLLLLLYSSSQAGLSRYGMSQNKLFDYLASGKPILSNLPNRYSIVNECECGIERSFSDSKDFVNQIRGMISDKDSMKRWGENARATAELYSFASHASHLIDIIEEITKEEQ